MPKNGIPVISSYLDMHKVHHHYKLPYTDSNYGNIFRSGTGFSERLKTLSKEDIIYGVDTHMVEEHNHLQNLLKIPFQKNSVSESYK
jgi:hypothetical protein